MTVPIAIFASGFEERLNLTNSDELLRKRAKTLSNLSFIKYRYHNNLIRRSRIWC